MSDGCTAAADVAAHQFADFGCSLALAFGNQARGRADLARRAVAALECIVIDERLLQGMERAIGGKAFDRGDVGAVRHDGQRQAGIHPAAFDQDRAGAALAVIASLLGAAQIEAIPQGIQQCRPGRDRQRAIVPVDIESDGHRSRLGD